MRSALILSSMLSVLIPVASAGPPPCCGPRVPGLLRPWEDPTDAVEPAEAEPSAPATAEASDEKKEPWNVDAPPWPLTAVPLDTTTGTWMNIDISPDGTQILFDLLGDIYALPIDGGDAVALTSGVSWDMQPRFSPDGTHIAFTSDRAGGDNVWIMNHDGSAARAVTQEGHRLLNSPVWTPDGRHIAARKHFTSRRSLGAGEIWQYHTHGGEGHQMTVKPNDQKDVGEPAFSPDGRYLYYSQDTTSGAAFEYNKDPNGQIYVIQRLDLQTQHTEALVTGPGGAVRPTPSPDGRKLAFVRRVRERTVLFVRDLVSGAEDPVYDELDRDMQETWAIHGVYPTMAWTADSQSIVLSAGGQIRRVHVNDGATQIIPFRVRDERQVADAVRFPVDVAPDTFHVRLLRWPEVAPDGGHVVYQALGMLFKRSLPDGEPQRLTRQDDHFEFYPSHSRDGRWIAYTTWNDDLLGTVRVVASSGGGSRVLTTDPGHYVETAVSPDGETVVYRKIGGGYLRSPLWSADSGIYTVPRGGGDPQRLTRNGTDPHFADSSTEVYVQRQNGEQRQLVRIDLLTREEVVVAESANAVRWRLSPDGKWLAFQERFQARVMPFAPVGRPIQVGPTNKAVPVATVSKSVGDYLHFSGDGQTLYWTTGPELFSANLAETLAALAPPAPDAADGADAAAPADDPAPADAVGIDISFDAPSETPEGTVLLRGGRVITMRGDEVIDDAAVLIEGNRIRAVGAVDDVTAPDDARVIDVTGLTLMPGLVDVHDHGPHGGNGIIPQRNWSLYAKLAFGVTTVHDPSHDTYTIFASSELGRAGGITAPRIFSTGTILYGADGDFKAEINSLADARTHVGRLQRLGAVSVKSYNQPRRDQRQQVLAAARELGMMVVPEGGSLLQHNLTMVVDGHTGVEHAIPIAAAYDDIRTLWAGTAVGYTPTLTVAYGGLWGENYWYQTTEVWDDERLMTFVPRFVVDPRARRRTMVPDDEFNHIAVARVCKELLDAGVKVNLGAHGQLPGLAHHWELWMFAQGGMTPLEVIRAGTLHPAHYVGLDGDIGSIEVGKLADLVVLAGNPLDDIRQTAAVRYTVANGRIFDASTMNEIWPRERNRGSFFWV